MYILMAHQVALFHHAERSVNSATMFDDFAHPKVSQHNRWQPCHTVSLMAEVDCCKGMWKQQGPDVLSNAVGKCGFASIPV